MKRSNIQSRNLTSRLRSWTVGLILLLIGTSLVYPLEIFAATINQTNDVRRSSEYHDSDAVSCDPAENPANQSPPADNTQSEPGVPGKVFLLGDSLSVGIEAQLPAALPNSEGWSIAGDTLGSRRINLSAGGVSSGLDVAQSAPTELLNADYVVVVLGTNQSTASKADIEGLLAAINKPKVFWLSVNTKDGSGVDDDRFNGTLAQVPGITVVSNTVTPDSDNVHYTSDGYAKLSQAIAAAIKGGAAPTPVAPQVNGACICPASRPGSISGDLESDGSGSNQRIGYVSGLAGPYILEQFAIHSLKALAIAKNVPESSTLTEEHVVALVAFAIGEGGDINNRNIFNPLNHGKISGDNGVLTGDGTSGFVKYLNFDDGVDSNARVLNGTYQQRVAAALIDPNTTAEQFMENLSYWSEFPGDKAWATASSDGVRGSTQRGPTGLTADEYYQGRIALVNQVRSNWEQTAGLVVGTEAEEQEAGIIKPTLLTYRPAGSSSGASDTTGQAPSSAVAGCDSGSGLSAEAPDIDMSKKDTFTGSLIDPTGVVLHWTGGDAGRTVDQFIGDIRSNKACGDAGCSVQFYVKGDGTIYQLVDPINTKTAHAAGANSCCIGIEIGGRGSDDLISNTVQKQAVINLTAYLVSEFNMQINPDMASLKGILSHHATPKGKVNGKTDVGDQYWLEIVSSVQRSANSTGGCPAGVSQSAQYKEWCPKLKELLDGPEKNRIADAKQAAIDGGRLLPEDQATAVGPTKISNAVVDDLNRMILDAAQASPAIKLEPVSGFRTFEEQALQRIHFCTANQSDVSVERVFFNSGADCSVSVLIPGTSNHNKGRAIDFGENGQTDNPAYANTPAYAWLVANASNYGFNTISGEPWHWEKP